ncbi:hypothetical protein V6Z11_A02G145700 [Gossypium hirsutum]
MSIHLHHVGLFEPEGILARNPSSTSISTKKGEEIHGLLARALASYGCAGVACEGCVLVVRCWRIGMVAGGVVRFLAAARGESPRVLEF